MSRDFEAIMKSSDSVQTAITKNEVVSLPPGYLVGFDVRLRPDYTVLISAGAANVGGSLVQTGSDHQLEEADWVAPKINSTRHYYIYLTKDGFFKVDIVAPVWNDSLLYYEQPDMNWRAVGKIFLVSSQIVYAVKQVELKGSTVTVAPEGFTGEADYYCTGENDQILINAAISYLSNVSNGGKCTLLRGDYYVSNSIVGNHSNIILYGESQGAIIHDRDATSYTYMVDFRGTSTANIENCSIESLSFVHDGSDTSCYATLIGYSNNSRVKGNYYYNFPIAVLVSRSDQITVSDNFFDGNDYQRSGANSTGILIYNDTVNTIPYIISGNRITKYETGIGINTAGDSVRVKVVDNDIYDMLNSEAGNYCYGIWLECIESTIQGNRIVGLENTDTSTNVRAIYIYPGSSNVNVGHNYCYNNGSDTGIANTNSNNFYDAGTDTQVYSNSWQSPVSGEPEQGELHWLPRSTNTLTSYFVNAVTTTAGWVSFTTSYPVGAKAMYANVQVVFVSSATGSCRHTVAFSDEYGSTPSYGTHHVLAGMTIYASAGGETIRQFIPCVIPLDANRKGYFYAETRTNATNCQVHIVGTGYTS